MQFSMILLGKMYRLKTGKWKLQSRFYKMNSVTLLGWFMKYMDKFMVIEPQMLRENIKTKLENTLEIMNNINGSQ